MKQNKDKQIREIRRDRDRFIFLWIAFMVVALLLSTWIGNLREDKQDLEKELQSYQDKVPVWTLEVECKSDDGVFNINFTTKEKFQYDFWIKYFEAEKCEVRK